MSRAEGSRLGDYEIVVPIGAGGTGHDHCFESLRGDARFEQLMEKAVQKSAMFQV